MYIELGGQKAEANLKVRNVLGTVVYEKVCHQEKTVLELSGLSNGVYFLEVSYKEGSQVLRFVKQ
jgi:hypothetical protein